MAASGCQFSCTWGMGGMHYKGAIRNDKYSEFSMLIESHCHLSSKWTSDWKWLQKCSFAR